MKAAKLANSIAAAVILIFLIAVDLDRSAVRSCRFPLEGLIEAVLDPKFLAAFALVITLVGKCETTTKSVVFFFSGLFCEAQGGLNPSSDR
jgi:hypothetical protein